MKDQRIRLQKSLKQIAANVTAADRTYCCKKLKISKVTVSIYLKGRVTNNDLAIEMIEIFNERIAVREEKLKTLCPNS